jgi:hypothetical protein
MSTPHNLSVSTRSTWESPPTFPNTNASQQLPAYDPSAALEKYKEGEKALGDLFDEHQMRRKSEKEEKMRRKEEEEMRKKRKRNHLLQNMPPTSSTPSIHTPSTELFNLSPTQFRLLTHYTPGIQPGDEVFLVQSHITYTKLLKTPHGDIFQAISPSRAAPSIRFISQPTSPPWSKFPNNNNGE